MSAIITVENLSKQYRLGNVGTGSIKDDVKRWWYRVGGREDPFLKIGDTNDRSTKAMSEYVWALRDISFEVQPGEVLGIIGRNGAGKSTLLKILSRVAEPTTGRIEMRGRVASLLEVGTGFHPDLTGRENIFLNGAILGMTRREVKSKFDEIVDFAGVQRYIDTPVKRYSSGMHVRLGFAVAAHLEPEILIVDEVLAVGDSEFQRKCLGKMKEVSMNNGRTVLFVSHNMSAIQRLCDSCLILENGKAIGHTNTREAVQLYLSNKSNLAAYSSDGEKNIAAFVTEAWCEGKNGNPVTEIAIGEKWVIRIKIFVAQCIQEFVCGVGLTTYNEIPINTSWHKPIEVEPGVYEACFEQNVLILATGKYMVQLGLMRGTEVLEYVPDAFGFEVVNAIERLDDTVMFNSAESGMILNPMQSSMKMLITGIVN